MPHGKLATGKAKFREWTLVRVSGSVAEGTGDTMGSRSRFAARVPPPHSPLTG